MTLRSPRLKREDVEREIIEAKLGISLDLGCGANKHPGFVGLDVRDLPGVDIVHDLNVYPWPLPDESVNRITCSHVVEHIPPVAISELGTWFPFVAVFHH